MTLIYLARRVIYAALTVWIALTLAFVALRLAPGDAIAAQLAQSGASAGQIAARRAALGLDQPLGVQYIAMLGGALRGDLGVSLSAGRPVSEMISEQLGATLALAAGAIVVAIGAGLSLGLIAALGALPLLRKSAAFVTWLLTSAPIYWSGILAIYLFSVQLRLLPSAGSDNTLQFLILPWSVLGLSIAGSLARVTAATLAENRDADFVRTARAKGLRERRIARTHILRAGLGPVIALIGLQTGYLIGGAVVTEMIFVRRGIGQILLRAVNERDYPVVQGVVALSAVAYSLTSAAADLIAGILDPRVR